jgi:hypothetical protein
MKCKKHKFKKIKDTTCNLDIPKICVKKPCKIEEIKEDWSFPSFPDLCKDCDCKDINSKFYNGEFSKCDEPSYKMTEPHFEMMNSFDESSKIKTFKKK